MASSYASNGALLLSTSGRTLPLRDTTVTSEAAGGIARTVLRQHFTNPHTRTLDFEYQFPLPADEARESFSSCSPLSNKRRAWGGRRPAHRHGCPLTTRHVAIPEIAGN